MNYTLSIILPAKNEAANLPPLLARLAVLWPTAEILVVDDGSTDATARIAREQGARVVSHPYGMGNGAAIKTGTRHAAGEVLVFMDADGQHDPAEIPAFLARYQTTHADLIIGARAFGHMPAVRRIANTVGRWSFSWALGQPVQDNQSGYRLLSRRMVEAILDSQEQGFEFEVEMIVTCVQLGYVLDWVPIRTIYGDQGSHIDPLHHAAQFSRVVFQTRRRMRDHEKTKTTKA